jgi:hypothetical protein
MSAFEEIVLIVFGLLLVGWTTMKVVSFAGCRRRRMARDPHQGLKNVLFVALWAIFIGLLLSMRADESDSYDWEAFEERMRRSAEAARGGDSVWVVVGLLAYHVFKVIDVGYLAVVETAGLLTAGGETNTLLNSALPIALLVMLALGVLVKCWPSEERDLVQLLRVIDRDPDQASRRRMIADMLNTLIIRNPTRDRASLLADTWRLVEENHLAVVANDMMMLQRQEEAKQE